YDDAFNWVWVVAKCLGTPRYYDQSPGKQRSLNALGFKHHRLVDFQAPWQTTSKENLHRL
ncbi:MAG: hypothetical protein QMC11_02105, partial [Rhodospirillales bacterium]